jgi:hypothetical protein
MKQYTPEQLSGKYIVYSPVLMSKLPALAPVTLVRGEFAGLPVLYNSERSAKSDCYYNPDFDIIKPASEFYEMIRQKEISIFNL